ncbi:MAG TPA: ferredoxin [Actinophytocola sp.]|uniref:ferredoxin n=1 Tax=Actinophytocola sp. TaxID=1872138 RepID=UPI002DBF4D21|nr:ferredoxin [Actinophytocola sp.]HEU5475351.1 ferredoxin [Actinophytocola sp.]
MSEERWRISVDRVTCQASGMCVAVAPQHFELRDGYSTPLAEEIDPDDEDVVEAAESCPVEAIMVTSTADGRVVAPEPY